MDIVVRYSSGWCHKLRGERVCAGCDGGVRPTASIVGRDCGGLTWRAGEDVGNVIE